MKKDSFCANLLLSVFDKLILGVLVAGIVFLFQQNVKQSQKLKDQIMAVSKVKSDILINQRNKMIEAMDKYFLLIEEIKPLGQPDTSQSKFLRQLRLEVELIKFNSDAIAPELGEALDPFHTAINKMNHFLIEKIHPKAEIEIEADKVREKYISALKSFQKIIIKTVEGEYGKSS